MDDTANHFDSPQSPDRPTPAPDDGWAASLDAGPRLARIRTARGGRPGAGRRAARHGLAWAVTGRAGLVVAAAVALTAVVNLPISHSTGPNPMGVVVLPPTGLRPAAMALAAFDSCPDLQAGLRSHAAAVVGPYGLPGTGSGPIYAVDAAPAGVASEASAANASAVPDHSTTNIHEVGVDEPDVVKTDGRRIVSVVGGVLRVVDTATRTVTGTLRLTPPTGPSALDLMLAGDRALVLAPAGDYPGVPLPGPAIDVPPGRPATEAGRYLLVDLSGEPRLIGSFSANGSYVDARLVGSTVRLVVRSTPAVRITPDLSGGIVETQLLARARQAVRGAPLSAWLPGYDVSSGGTTRHRNVPCTAVSHPVDYTGASMLTIYTVDLRGNLSDLAPLSIAADGDTVYGTSTSLYVASNPTWWPCCASGGGVAVAEGDASGPVDPTPLPPARPESTQIHRFDITGPGRPVYLGSGSVPGRLLDQYSLSDYQNHLRVVTTTTTGPRTESGLYVLDADTLKTTGRVAGLGAGERLYAVRLLGSLGYVVTFRNTDPLYVLDLRDPAAPRVAGELRITGYSTYLHPVGDGRLLGVGQEASPQGRVAGMQVSLFDVSEPAAPRRLDRTVRPRDVGEQQLDPHAFLYWPATGTVVVPVDAWDGPDVGAAWVLRVNGNRLETVGLVAHPAATADQRYQAAIERSLVVGTSLWTMSERGLQAVDLAGLGRQAWIPFS